MRLLNINIQGQVQLAVETDQGIIAINQLNLSQYPKNTDELVQNPAASELMEEINSALQNHLMLDILSPEKLEYAAALIKAGKILCIGLNYRKHAQESGHTELPKEPLVFSKFNNSLAAHKQPIPLPKGGREFDYEVELAVIIGKEARQITKEEALDYVFGYTIANDLSVRDWQFKSSQWLLGKSPDFFAPLGPIIVTADEIEPHELNISLRRNGVVVQSANTSEMLFSVEEIIAYLSQHLTLLPGDVILTGTPEGVILGQAADEQVWLNNKDILEACIEKIGVLRNSFLA